MRFAATNISRAATLDWRQPLPTKPADIRTSQHTAPVPIHRYFSIRNDRSNDHAEQGDEVAGREWGRGVGGGNGGGVSHAVCGIAGSAGGR